ncbi:DUF1501 domain-containing protein [Arcobacter sp. LA11]|uniref:DUF1501 domain-containing protein n=1 Tax=Arcobacter sp. LA11 TaxID=1898176 RepID=UPI00093547B7|nr:DUF1501 domain-containing protein [Arcobacter sp. LA11]
MQRRDFVKLSLFCASAILFPIDVKAISGSKKTLILVELDGGNDGLNTLVPYRNKNYYKLRPTIGLKKEKINEIEEDFGLNKSLRWVSKLYREKNCAFIHGLGYDKPNFSHFRSIEIVETASKSNEYLDEGWISKTLQKYDLNDMRPANAILLGKRKKGHLFSKDLNILQVKNIKQFIQKASFLDGIKSNVSINSSLDFLNKEKESIKRSSKSLEKYVNNIDIKTDFEETDISNDFKEAARIIKSKIDIPVIKISQKGYDTHANQIERQNKLLKEFDNAIKSFVDELKLYNLFDDVLIVTYSEFGRRVKENGSNGTDHGTASSQFVIGGKVKGGMYGKAPSLDNLKKNNLIYTTHYRTYYNTILSKWFNNKNNQFNSYDILNFL